MVAATDSKGWSQDFGDIEYKVKYNDSALHRLRGEFVTSESDLKFVDGNLPTENSKSLETSCLGSSVNHGNQASRFQFQVHKAQRLKIKAEAAEASLRCHHQTLPESNTNLQ